MCPRSWTGGGGRDGGRLQLLAARGSADTLLVEWREPRPAHAPTAAAEEGLGFSALTSGVISCSGQVLPWDAGQRTKLPREPPQSSTSASQGLGFSTCRVRRLARLIPLGPWCAELGDHHTGFRSSPPWQSRRVFLRGRLPGKAEGQLTWPAESAAVCRDGLGDPGDHPLAPSASRRTCWRSAPSAYLSVHEGVGALLP